MAGEAKPDSLMVMPVKGKYSEVLYDNKVYKIWRSHPNTPDKVGTLIPYDVAVYLLGKVPPLITLVPVIVNGENVSPLLPEDIEKIQESLEQGFVGGISNYNKTGDSLKGDDKSSGSDEALKQALALLAAQTEQNSFLQDALRKNSDALEAMQKRVDGIEKKNTPVAPAKAAPASAPVAAPGTAGGGGTA
jgi:hypothetical protein